MAGRKFGDMPVISAETLKVLDSLGFSTATPVQEATIPLFAGNKDVAVDACTGSGKTLAFVVPIIEKLRKLEASLKKHQVGAIVVSPTRELARQIHTVAAAFVASIPGLTSLLLVGGSDPAVDVAAFRATGGHVIIGTPGRIDDVMKRCPQMDCKALEVLVLDEADRLLDMGFTAQLDAIMARLPKQRRTGLFSATQTEAVQALARAGLRNPVRVNVAVSAAPPPAGTSKKGAAGKAAASGAAAAAAAAAGAGGGAAAAVDSQQRTPSSLSITYLTCESHQKFAQLVKFLQEHASDKVIVYFLTCSCVDYYALVLKRLPQLRAVSLMPLHGKMKQAQREAALAAYAEAPAAVLLCTDLASRGLDIPDVSWIVQFDPPQDPAAFVHRVGRTARMGRSGNAVVYLLPHEASYVDFLRLRKIPLSEAACDPGAPMDVVAALRREAEGDREVMEKGVKAFVSYVRGYKEHVCKFIFRLADLHVGHLATAFGVLRLPKMAETKKAKGASEFVVSEVDPDSVKFKDKAREKQRLSQLAARQAKQAEEKAAKAQAHAARVAADSEKRLPAAKRRLLQHREEMDDLTREYALLKKLKKGKISEREFDIATGLESASDDDDVLPGGGGGSGKASGSGRRPAAGGAGKRGRGGGGLDDDSYGDFSDSSSDGDVQRAGSSGRPANGASRPPSSSSRPAAGDAAALAKGAKLAAANGGHAMAGKGAKQAVSNGGGAKAAPPRSATAGGEQNGNAAAVAESGKHRKGLSGSAKRKKKKAKLAAGGEGAAAAV